jgi:putative phage-type endonuclease
MDYYNFDLLDCSDEIIPDENIKYLSEEDELELYEMCSYLMYEFIEQYPTIITDPNFEEIFEENINELVHLHFVDSIHYTEDAEEEVDEIIEHCKDDFFKYIIPPRSYSSSIILDKPNIEKITEQINILRSKPQPTQRTKEWYLNRFNLITASNAYKIFESQSMKNQLIYEKCKPLVEDENEEYKFINVNSPLHWGQKYEPVSVMIYEQKFGTIIEDFGCITHDKYNFLGASPDGINVDETNERYGRMLEIKNIVNREIDGIPKKEYWIQMQLQMEVCNLNECDFLETKFIEYEDFNKFKEDSMTDIDTEGEEFINLRESLDNKLKGTIIYFQKKNGTPFYHYMPFDLYDEQDINEWLEGEIEKYESEPYKYMYVKMIHWKLEKISCVLLCRNKEWFKMNVEEMENIWKLIEYERINGYEHRQPNRRITNTNTNIIVNKICNQQENNEQQNKQENNEQQNKQQENNKQTNKNIIPSIGLNLQLKNNKEPPKCLLKIIKK